MRKCKRFLVKVLLQEFVICHIKFGKMVLRGRKGELSTLTKEMNVSEKSIYVSILWL